MRDRIMDNLFLGDSLSDRPYESMNFADFTDFRKAHQRDTDGFGGGSKAIAKAGSRFFLYP